MLEVCMFLEDAVYVFASYLLDTTHETPSCFGCQPLLIFGLIPVFRLRGHLNLIHSVYPDKGSHCEAYASPFGFPKVSPLFIGRLLPRYLHPETGSWHYGWHYAYGFLWRSAEANPPPRKHTPWWLYPTCVVYLTKRNPPLSCDRILSASQIGCWLFLKILKIVKICIIYITNN